MDPNPAPARPPTPALSLVLPMHDAADFVVPRITELVERLRGRFDDGGFEVVVADDGSTDASVALVRSLGLAGVRVLGLPRRGGKFHALRAGVGAARGQVVAFTDIDVPYDLGALWRGVELVQDGAFHLVVGDRTLPESRSEDAPGWLRRASSRVFRSLVRVLVAGGVGDTQCALKVMPRDAARALFAAGKEDGFVGDVELVFLALASNLALRRIPVRLVHNAPSSVRLFQDVPSMAWGCLRILVRYHAGGYDLERLRALGLQPLDDVPA